MFYCSSGGSDPLNMSKSGILRGIITEKLSTAAREILAVVERTVADYEEEASGFRREIERQRRQLELLQPQIKLPRTELELLPDLQSHEEVVVGEEQEEQQLTQSTGVEAAESHNPPGKHSEEEEEDDDEGEDGGNDEEVEQENDEDEQEDEESVIKNKMIKEDLKDPDFEIPPRSVQRGHKRHRLTLKMDTKEPLNLRIRILEDSETTVLSNAVFKKYPIWDLGCPHGLEEAAFLDLLRSTFPQLAAGEPFDTFITDKSRKLQPLNVKALTPEEINTAIKSNGNSALYIRPKV
ncbi:ATP-dependent RNA helicase ddx54 isoform X7 [Fundulus heteroclitus]|uniref:ATP-dependent RNA helicase ddx54 isoform X7 n=1 Tax=Fundulus heteroclitus TaxID=8078 RepID=UPI00165BF70A|nr:ATP-dependent RNA helicase ddx54 isoform X7 [Fundulus heteroclitus]